MQNPVTSSYLADQQLKQAVLAPPWAAAEAPVAGAIIRTTAATVPVKRAAILRMVFSILGRAGASVWPGATGCCSRTAPHCVTLLLVHG